MIERVDRSFKNFYNGFGYLRFQGKKRYNSFTYPQFCFGLKDGKLILSKIGRLKIILHREIEGKIKTCTIKKDIDVGLSSLITLSNGTQIEPPEFLRGLGSSQLYAFKNSFIKPGLIRLLKVQFLAMYVMSCNKR